MVECPGCGGPINLGPDREESESITCPDCGVELEVVSLDPPTLEVAPEVEEDWGE
jgi:alpha-aminoadipate carrier protein LysW